MISSIRGFLLVNLLISLTLITSLAVIGNLFSEHRDFQNHLDSQLTLAAYTIDSFLSQKNNDEDYQTIQKRIQNFPMQTADHAAKTQDLRALLDSIQFQVWDHRERLVLHSQHDPGIPLMDQETGFSNIWKNSEPWRVFTLATSSGHHIVVMQEHSFRIALEKRITRNSIYVMILAYPLLGFLIWIVVGRGLSSVSHVVEAIRRRESGRLEPLELDDEVPKEIVPLVNELNSLFGRLKETFLREKRFAADAAHELRTPLAALNAQAQVAASTKDPNQREEALQKLKMGVERSTHVIQQLLTMSRMVPEAMEQNFEKIDLRHIATETIAEIASLAIDKDITLELKVDGAMLMYGNAVALGVMLRNLVDNAIRYTPKGGDVTVTICQLPADKSGLRDILLSIEDTGPGVDIDLRARIFERFYRVISTTNEKGSGLGLGIVSQIAKIHHATLEPKTPRSGKGLRIDITFPASDK